MPLGLNKSDKQPQHESDPAGEEVLDTSEDTGSADSEGSDPSPTDQSEPSGQPHGDGHEAMAFRPAFLNSDMPGESAPAAQPPRGDAFFISVSRDERVETHRFDGPSQAQTFVEQLLEEGVPEDGVTAFSGHRVTLRVTNRPVVKLVAAQDG